MGTIDGQKRCAMCREPVSVQGRMRTHRVVGVTNIAGKMVEIVAEVCDPCWREIVRDQGQKMSIGCRGAGNE